MGIGRRLKATAIWVDPEDKDRFEKIMFDYQAETQARQTQESTFKFLLDNFFKIRGENHANIDSSKP